MKAKRALAYPLAIGTEVRLQGRVKESANLIEPGHRLLDIGCSSGWLAPLVIRKGFTEYVGMDRVIVGHAPDHAHWSFVAGSVFGLPFRDQSFDAVCLFDVIEHLPRGTERMALHEVHRVLTVGGKFYFSTPHASPIHTPLDPVWSLGHRHYRRATIRRLMQSTDFTLDRMFVAGGIIEGLDHIRLLIYKHIFRRPQPHIEFLTRLVERTHGHDRRWGMTVFATASRV